MKASEPKAGVTETASGGGEEGTLKEPAGRWALVRFTLTVALESRLFVRFIEYSKLSVVAVELVLV